MERFTISLDEDLARQFDAFIAQKGYVNRSEAVRDLIRGRLGHATLGEAATAAGTSAPAAEWCVATVGYVYDHHEATVTARVLDLQHDHHDLVITSLHTHLDHDNCMETVVLRGPVDAVRACADRLVALRGVRHGNVHMVPLGAAGRPHTHAHGHGHAPALAPARPAVPLGPHVHFKPIN